MNLKTNPELLPLVEWWEKDGKQMVLWLVVAAVAVGGWYGWKAHKAAMKNAAADALVSAFTTEEIEDAAVKFSGTATEGALKLRLAKSYFDAGRYDEALAAYQGLVGKAPEGFEDIPVVGQAQCLEAQGKYAEALKAFDDFAAANAKHYLTLTAQLGAARALAQLGKKDEALARLKSLKDDAKDDEIAKARVEATESAVKRYKPAPATPVAPVGK